MRNQNKYGQQAPPNQQRMHAQSAQNPYARENGQGNRHSTAAQQANQQTMNPQRQAEMQKRRKEALEKKRKLAEQQKKQAAAMQKKEAAKRKAAEKRNRREEKYTLTEEEREIREQMKKEEREFRARKRARRTKVFFGRFVIFLAMFVSLFVICVGLFYANLVQYEHSARQNFTYIVGGTRSTVAYEKMQRNGNLYVNMTPIVNLCEMAVTGDTQELRFITRDAKEHVQFIVGSTQVFINGVEKRLTCAPYMDGEDLYVPYDFFQSYVSGISVLYDQEKQTVTAQKTLVEGETDQFEALRFIIRSDAPLVGLDEYNEFGNTQPIDFLSDLSLYEEYMNPADRDDYLILVNNEYPLPQAYNPYTIEITDIRRDGRPLQYLCPIAERAAHAMIMELQANGFTDVNILLGYRSYAKQNNLYESTVKDYMTTMTEEQARVTASSIVQAAGCNPQQAGLSMIMHNLEDTSTAFSREAAYAWLEKNCWKFGFIIRYPADKAEETRMAFQPYFFTFVGRYHAMRIMEGGLSMEAYIKELEEKDYFKGQTYAEFRETLINS
ncbi:MAG: D-alanyl-D-alanine carboxypeptidase family protein [Clostridia bacterium]|nr:D-alanyl-D-alanine carboxypeptidase family protein [Clostridia bacterium]